VKAPAPSRFRIKRGAFAGRVAFHLPDWPRQKGLTAVKVPHEVWPFPTHLYVPSADLTRVRSANSQPDLPPALM
jgi:hypothetical protein